jgi:hypothetical protein
VVDLGKQLLHLVLGEGFRQGTSPTHHVTRFDRVPRDASLLNKIVKEMFQRMETPMDRRGG